ncbi:MAG: hypothetical protein ACRDFS_09560 [Chloroflexota bacterium]
MSALVEILLILVVIKFLISAGVLLWIFRPDPRELFKREPEPTEPACLYCQSKYTHAVGEAEPRWEEDVLVLVTTYECEHCRMPFWHVERVPAGVPTR